MIDKIEVKVDAKISIVHYHSFYYHYPCLLPKYIWRPITFRINSKLLFEIIDWHMTKYIYFYSFLIKYLPRKISTIVRRNIPITIWNYISISNFPQDKESFIAWSILDTFDALDVKHDKLLSKLEVTGNFKRISLKKWIKRSRLNVITFNGIK